LLISLKRSFVLKLLFVVATVVLLLNTVALTRDYQDSWILEGLEISFTFFVIVFTLTFFSERKESWLVIIAVAGRIVLLLIPNLKYVWYQGVYEDQGLQFNLSNFVMTTGHISPFSSTMTPEYTGSPLFHLLFTSFSLILNVPIVDAMKFVPILFAPLYPLLTYVIVKKLGFAHGNITKYALFLSAIPTSIITYEVVGTMFGILLVLAILSLLVSVLNQSHRRYAILTIFFVFALAAAHTVSSVVLCVLLLCIILFQKVPLIGLKSAFRNSVALASISIICAWLLFSNYPALTAVVRIFVTSGGSSLSSESIPSTFFSLVNTDIFGAITTFSVYYGCQLFLLVLVLVGLFMMLRTRNKLHDSDRLLIFLSCITVVFILVGAVIEFGPTRALAFESILFPFFGAIAIFSIYRQKNWLAPLIFIPIIFLATIQVYACQPLITSANIVYPELPNNVPIGYANGVNSIYQRQLTTFVFSYVTSGAIASDATSYFQLLALANSNFKNNHMLKYFPPDHNLPVHGYNYFMTHIPGKAGVMDEPAQLRSPDLICQTVYNSSVVYSNGESFLLLNDNS
jgi:hypothetical protein